MSPSLRPNFCKRRSTLWTNAGQDPSIHSAGKGISFGTENYDNQRRGMILHFWGSQKVGFQKGGFGGCSRNQQLERGYIRISPVPETRTRVHADVPQYQKPERGHIRRNRPLTQPPFCFLSNILGDFLTDLQSQPGEKGQKPPEKTNINPVETAPEIADFCPLSWPSES